jgi:hypothetical protein
MAMLAQMGRARWRRRKAAAFRQNQAHYEVYRNGRSGLGKEATLSAVAVLEDHDWLRTDRVVTGGRPSLRCLITHG